MEGKNPKGFPTPLSRLSLSLKQHTPLLLERTAPAIFRGHGGDEDDGVLYTYLFRSLGPFSLYISGLYMYMDGIYIHATLEIKINFFKVRSIKIRLLDPFNFGICWLLGQAESDGWFRSSNSAVDSGRRFSRNASLGQEN